jgi:hypothetical protein
MKRVLQSVVLMFAVAVFIAGCEKSETPVNVPSSQANPEVQAPVAKGVAAQTSNALATSSQSPLAKGWKAMGIVTVIHGVPGLVVDVYVNGKLTLPGFEPGSITPPLKLPEGHYKIQITLPGDPVTKAVITGETDLPAGANASIIAHLSATGTPELSVYVNNLAGLRRGKGRLVVRHDAAAPAVDVKLYRGGDQKKLVATIANLSNPNEASADVRPGRYNVTLSAAGSMDVAFGPVPLKPKPGVAYFVYAYGTLGKDFGLLVQTIDISRGKHHEGDDDDDRDRD